jgi:endogenous inhibitor of DNA gyrase (YacG/DUF329 family)
MSACPTCHKPAEKDFAPFCSKRCREVDLNRWFTGSYAVPAMELDDIDEESIEEAMRAGDGSSEKY